MTCLILALFFVGAMSPLVFAKPSAAELQSMQAVETVMSTETKPAVATPTAMEAGKDEAVVVTGSSVIRDAKEPRIQDGKIEIVTPAEIIISDGEGNRTAYVVTATTTIYGAKGSPVAVKDLKNGNIVKIKGITQNGSNVAASIYRMQ